MAEFNFDQTQVISFESRDEYCGSNSITDATYEIFG